MHPVVLILGLGLGVAFVEGIKRGDEENRRRESQGLPPMNLGESIKFAQDQRPKPIVITKDDFRRARDEVNEYMAESARWRAEITHPTEYTPEEDIEEMRKRKKRLQEHGFDVEGFYGPWIERL